MFLQEMAFLPVFCGLLRRGVLMKLIVFYRLLSDCFDVRRGI